MFDGSWLTNAFQFFLKALFPFSSSTTAPAAGWKNELLGVWIPDLGRMTSDGFGWVLALTVGLGAAIALWFAGAALLTAIAARDARAIGQVLIGLTVVSVSGPVTLWIAAQLRQPVLDTASALMGDWIDQMVTQTLESANLAGLLMIVIASFTYLIAGLLGGYAFVLVAALAPIASASLVFRSGTGPFFKWLTWFLSLLLAPVWVAMAFGIAGAVQAATDAALLKELSQAVGIIVAAAAPFTMLAVVGKIVPHGGAADTSTKVGAGTTAGSAVAYSAPRALK